jgi:hypothetical protein
LDCGAQSEIRHELLGEPKRTPLSKSVMQPQTIAQVAQMPLKRRMALWLGYINAIPWCPGELDHQEFAAFSKSAFWGIGPGLAFDLVLGQMRQCGAKNLRIHKIKHSLASAYASGGEGDHGVATPLDLPPAAPYDAGLLSSTVGDLAGAVDASYFISRSPFSTWNRTPAGFLHKLFRPGEKVWVTANDRSVSGCLWSHGGVNQCEARWITSVEHERSGSPNFGPNFSCLDFFERGQPNVWFLANPIDGAPHQSQRFDSGHSYRCIEAVTCWRYLVLETDVAPPALWLALLALLPLRIVAIYHSGSRGAHALVRIDAASKTQADDIVEIYRREYVPLGACKGTLSAFRLTRLPNCFRGQTGQWQQLLFLNPEADATPIKDLPIKWSL